jgi:hypothetical protein
LEESKMDLGDVLYFVSELIVFGIQIVEDNKRKH